MDSMLHQLNCKRNRNNTTTLQKKLGIADKGGAQEGTHNKIIVKIVMKSRSQLNVDNTYLLGSCPNSAAVIGEENA
jgi:hypothetical protein